MNDWNAQIKQPSEAAMDAARKHWDGVAKPIGSLGALESHIVKIAGLTGTENVRLQKRGVLVFAADNGVLAQGVAMTPGEVTRMMTELIAAGRSSVCRMANAAHADVTVTDMGVFTRPEAENIRDCRLGDGTCDMTEKPAMTRAQAIAGIETGIALAAEKKAQGYDILITGEMGIGNTTTSSAVAAALLGKTAEDVTGRGAGLSDEGLARKRSAITRAIAVNKPDPSDALDVLAKVGGFDIAAMTGVFIGGAIHRVPVVIDGYISAVSALVASRICPASVCAMLPSHVSAEPAGYTVLDALGMKPLITAGLRLGEGTGAVCLLPLLDLALAVYDTACTYADLGM